MHEVKPVTGAAPANVAAPPPANLSIAQTRFFAYALPQGWKIAEEGQFALVLSSADGSALTVMVGNSGQPPNYPPDRFVREKLSALQPENLRVGNARQAMPVAGFPTGYQFEVDYTVRGVRYHGLAKCSVATSYDTAVMAMTAALAPAGQWPAYSTWLPLVADQISATNGAAFGMRGIMQQNLQNSTAYAEAARQYREWSQRNWQQVTDQRNASQDENNRQFRDALGGVQSYSNPYDTSSAPVQLPTTYKYYWVSPDGTYVGTDDPSVNPNTGSQVEWRPLSPYQAQGQR